MGTSGGVGGGGVSTPAAILSRAAATLGLVAVTMPWHTAQETNNGLNLSSGLMLAQLIRPGAVTVTNLGTALGISGVGSTGVNGMALYDAAGGLIDQTVDMTTHFGTATPVFIEAALTGGPLTLSADTNYYIACLTHFSTTVPKIAGSVISLNLPAIKGNIPSIQIPTQATFPASFNPATVPKNNGTYFLTAS